MTLRQKQYKKALITAVHLSKKYRSYYKDNKDEYQTRLEAAFGVSSSKELSIKDLETLVGWLNETIDDLPELKPPSISKPQKNLLRELWCDYARDKSDIALLKFAQKVTKTLYITVEAITLKDATKLIVALKHSLQQGGGKNGR